MKDPAQFEKYFNRCPSCNGLGFEEGHPYESRNLCSVCHGDGLTLPLQGSELAVALPLFIDYAARFKAQIYKVILFFLAAAFIFGVPYVLYVNAADFIRKLTAL